MWYYTPPVLVLQQNKHMMKILGTYLMHVMTVIISESPPTTFNLHILIDYLAAHVAGDRVVFKTQHRSMMAPLWPLFQQNSQTIVVYVPET